MVKAALLLASLFLVVALIETASVQNDYLDEALEEALKGSEVEDREKTFEGMMDEALISSILEGNEMATVMEEQATSQIFRPLFKLLENSTSGQLYIGILVRKYCRF